MKRIKPVDAELRNFCLQWDSADRADKDKIASYYEVTYGTACNWRSQAAGEYPFIKDSLSTYLPDRAGDTNAPLNLQTSKEMQTVAVINDTHNPYQDVRALALAELLLEKIQPAVLVYNGDINDFYQLSSFDKDPKRVSQMQEDVDGVKDMFDRHNRILPDTRKILLGGNHEERLQRFLWAKASALSSLECLSISELYGLKDRKIDYVLPECGLMVNQSFLIIHGDLISSNSSYTAKRMFDKHGGSGMHGHTHRGGSYYKRNRFGIFGWWENFCLCDLNPDWVKHPDWQHGFSLVHFTESRFWVEQIPIVNNVLIYGGEVYSV